MIRRPPRSTQSRSSAASDVYKRQVQTFRRCWCSGPSHRNRSSNLCRAELLPRQRRKSTVRPSRCGSVEDARRRERGGVSSRVSRVWLATRLLDGGSFHADVCRATCLNSTGNFGGNSECSDTLAAGKGDGNWSHCFHCKVFISGCAVYNLEPERTSLISLIFGKMADCCAGLCAGTPTRHTKSPDPFDTTVRLILQYDAACTLSLIHISEPTRPY